MTTLSLREQRDLLWNKAQRVLNKSNSADDTWVKIPKSCLDELGRALLLTSGPETRGNTLIPSLGRIVLYKMTAQDADAINKRRKDAATHLDTHRVNSNGVQVHVGNQVTAGDVYPMIITRVWGDTETSSVNGQVLLDGNDLFWVTSVSQAIPTDALEHSLESLPERRWIVPPRV